MSQFQDVDAVGNVAPVEAYLDLIAQRLAGMKRYMVGAHLAAGSTFVLDLGCGAGHDLALLADAGVPGVGIDPSAGLLRAARHRLSDHALLVRARGEAVPIRDEAFDGCRIERVLQHVSDPEVLVREAVRCLRPGGLLTVFEPDWSSLRVESTRFDDDASGLVKVRRPSIGADLARLVERAGAEVVDEVEERSVYRTLSRLSSGIDLAGGLRRRVADGDLTQADADAWLAEQQARDRDGTFRATLTKTLVVARRL